MTAALLIVDMQNEFVHPRGKMCVAGAAHTVPNIGRVLQAWRDKTLPVAYAVRRYRPDGSDVEPVRRDLFGREGGFCLPNTWGSEVVPELRPLADETVVVKPRWSAFFRTELDSTLRRWNTDTLVIAGTQTPNCVRATAFDADALGYGVIVLSDGTSSQTPDVQRANLYDLQNAGFRLMTCEETVQAVERGALGRPANSGA